LIQRLLLGSGGEHCDLELAVDVRGGKEEGGRRKEEGGDGPADINSDNPHLAGGEKTLTFYLAPFLANILAFYLAICLAIFLVGVRVCPDLSGACHGVWARRCPGRAGILGILSGITLGILFGIFSGIYSDILSGIYFDILSRILYGKYFDTVWNPS
jgi:hypothetical protein